MSESTTIEPLILSPPRNVARRPGIREFDSLQDLLEQAGYKETRIFTPLAAKTPASPPQISAENISPTSITSGADNYTIPVSVEGGGGGASGWFTTLWQSSDSNNKKKSIQRGSLNRKQSEPVLSRKGRKAVQKSWMGFWNARKASDGREDETQPVPSLPSKVVSPKRSPAREIQRVLRQTPSTNNLWQGSMHHHRSRLTTSRSFPTRLLEQKGNNLTRKESYDGARVVAGVGFGAAKTTAGDIIFKGARKQRISLRQAFGQDADGKEEGSGYSSQTRRDDWRDSISSLVDLEERRTAGKAEMKIDDDTVEKVISTMNSRPNLSLFGSAATPLLSRQDAVALRNVGCLDFAGSPEDNVLDRTNAKRLRKMRSVDALELALSKMERQQYSVSKAPSGLQGSIPESFSTDSLTNEDFANATTTTTLLMDKAQPDSADSMTAMSGEVIQRSFTPQLMITSPTGMRSPQPLNLEGQEFEPRSISPEIIRVVRPIANRRSGWKLNAVIAKPAQQDATREESRIGRSGDAAVVDSRVPSQIARRSGSKKKGRMTKSREDGLNQEGSKLPVPTKNAKKRLSRSCNNLRENALAQIADVASSSAGKLSGSEQVRALRRDIMNRKGGRGSQEQIVHVTEESRQDGPSTSNLSDDDDPFNDFVAVTKSSNGSSSNQQPLMDRYNHIDRSGMTPIPFQHSQQQQRRPLSITQQINIQPPPNSSNVIVPGKPLSRKKSGVGLACLVEKENSQSMTTSARSNDANPLLESPTAHVVKKRSSRTRLGHS